MVGILTCQLGQGPVVQNADLRGYLRECGVSRQLRARRGAQPVLGKRLPGSLALED